MDVLKYTNTTPIWEICYQIIIRDGVFSLSLRTFHNAITELSEFTVFTVEFLVISFSIIKLFSGILTIGALITLMILNFRILASFHTTFISII